MFEIMKPPRSVVVAVVGITLAMLLTTTLPVVAKSRLADEVTIDYSHAGYRESSVDLPRVVGRLMVGERYTRDTYGGQSATTPPIDRSGDIQKALDMVASLPADSNGHRGAVVLAEGRYYLERPLRIKASGVVLRGADKAKTTLVYGGADRGAGVYIENVSEAAVEQLTLISDFNPLYPKDENHLWTGIYIDNAQDCWVRDADFYHFAGAAVVVHKGASRITVDNCRALEPKSEIGGLRRRAFLTFGHKTLFIRCLAEVAIHAFSAGSGARGPNVFVQCEADRALSFSGSTGSGATELLFDIVDIIGHDIVLGNLGSDKQQAGWNALSSTLWQCSAARIHVESPDSCPNAAYGCHGQFWGNGVCLSHNDHISPRSLFEHQLKARGIKRRLYLLPRNLKTATSPTIEQAQQLHAATRGPLLTLSQWIDSVSAITHIDVEKRIDRIGVDVQRHRVKATTDIFSLSGGRQSVQWWNGNLTEKAVAQAKDHITRFVPDMEGRGYTDHIDSVVRAMKAAGNIILEHNYGLWYDRRRDDHTRVMRRDGDVWAPFYEQPFARSGEGRAWDGLSLYDLTRPNEWYWKRLQDFAFAAEHTGIILFHNHYFQHNIIEAGAHWVDSPWRSANNINNTGFNEPVHFSGDKRIFQAEQFYDTAHAVRRELHRHYIRESLNRFADYSNVVHFISAEYTGPLHFVQFWLDVIAEWQCETGRDAIVALSCTKDVQDAILDDPQREAVVDIIDIRYWHYREDGSLYAPPGGKNMAPRQHARKMDPGTMGYKGAYKSVREYVKRYPKKKVILSAQDYHAQGSAVRKAGGTWPAPSSH